MIDERHEELAALHAFDLLEGVELASFESALARDPALRALVAELRDTSAALAHTAPDAAPPAALKDRVLASVSESKIKNRKSKIISFPALAPWLAAAGFAVTTAWFGQLYFTSRSDAALLRDEQALAAVALKGARNQLEAERIFALRQFTDLTQQAGDTARQLAVAQQQLAAKDQLVADLGTQLKSQADLANFKITTLALLLNNTPQALAVAVWNPARQEGVLQVEKLPALTASQSYQLWVVDPQYPNPVDGGIFTVDPQTGDARVPFKARQAVATVAAFAVTLERKGGVPKAEGPFVLLGK
ncbi:MAG: hypothetical protein EXS32_02860 [Opitutus sp.]|nr:hypothetical protein [Opitutus sp.]